LLRLKRKFQNTVDRLIYLYHECYCYGTASYERKLTQQFSPWFICFHFIFWLGFSSIVCRRFWGGWGWLQPQQPVRRVQHVDGETLGRKPSGLHQRSEGRNQGRNRTDRELLLHAAHPLSQRHRFRRFGKFSSSRKSIINHWGLFDFPHFSSISYFHLRFGFKKTMFIMPMKPSCLIFYLYTFQYLIERDGQCFYCCISILPIWTPMTFLYVKISIIKNEWTFFGSNIDHSACFTYLSLSIEIFHTFKNIRCVTF